jgi:hypothetical protein
MWTDEPSLCPRANRPSVRPYVRLSETVLQVIGENNKHLQIVQNKSKMKNLMQTTQLIAVCNNSTS